MVTDVIDVILSDPRGSEEDKETPEMKARRLARAWGIDVSSIGAITKPAKSKTTR